ncbi:hypothetical protein PR048_018308 [Dryococelus australis]|uniref:Uncharacterized protein n=1 Tax=Dryococelus australis TaxID=614101 RepID=A0ABQ9HBW3_9NEOP|nr:hypothetical protein PR048_018308 [Dryococelus australis]
MKLPVFRMWESCRTMPLVGGFLGDLPFHPPVHSGAAPYSRGFSLFDSQDLDADCCLAMVMDETPICWSIFSRRLRDVVRPAFKGAAYLTRHGAGYEIISLPHHYCKPEQQQAEAGTWQQSRACPPQSRARDAAMSAAASAQIAAAILEGFALHKGLGVASTCEPCGSFSQLA